MNLTTISQRDKKKKRKSLKIIKYRQNVEVSVVIPFSGTKKNCENKNSGFLSTKYFETIGLLRIKNLVKNYWQDSLGSS